MRRAIQCIRLVGKNTKIRKLEQVKAERLRNRFRAGVGGYNGHSIHMVEKSIAYGVGAFKDIDLDIPIHIKFLIRYSFTYCLVREIKKSTVDVIC